MVRHIVLIRFRPEVTETRIAELFEELHRIEGKVPGLLSIVSGASESPEAMERGYMHGFIVDFTDWAGLQAYQDNAEHQAFGARLVAHSEGGKDGLLVFDLPMAR